MKHPTSVELAPHRVPITGAVWVCTGEFHPPKISITRNVREERHVWGSHASGHMEKTRGGTATPRGCAAGRGDPRQRGAMDLVTPAVPARQELCFN